MYLFIGFSVLLLTAYAVLIEFYRRSWNQISSPAPDPEQRPASVQVSIIIPARNEETNIGACLHSILDQDYPYHLIEVIVVNDHSTDKTRENVLAFSDPRIKLIDLEFLSGDPGTPAYKKKAIEAGIRQSRFEMILCTDADCTAGKTWLSEMATAYQLNQAAFLAAPVRVCGKKTLLSVFECLDFLALQGITGASVFKGFHSMCNGANLAYRREAFFEVDGFKGIDSIPSGDDMLLMHKIARKYPKRIFYVKKQAAIVSTPTAANWNAFIQQRIRWASKSDQYEDKTIFFALLLVWLLNFCLLVLLLSGFWNPRWFILGTLLICIKASVEFPFMISIARFYDQVVFLKYFLFMQPFHIVYTVCTGLLGKLVGYEWKGRKIK